MDEVVSEMQELFVVLILVEGKDGHSIFELVEVGVGCVVYQQQVLQTAVLYYPQILYVHSFLGLPAV